MAVAGVACTGCSGEDYAVPGYNALVLETNDPRSSPPCSTSCILTLYVNAASDVLEAQQRSSICGRRLSNICSCLASTSWPNARRSPLLKHPTSLAGVHAHASCRMRACPPLAEWMADRLKRRRTSREDGTLAHVTIVRR